MSRNARIGENGWRCFAKIASLQGATFGIQFKSLDAGDFSPVSPFSPLHAFLDVSDFLSQKFDIFYLLSVSGKGPSRVELCTADIKQ